MSDLRDFITESRGTTTPSLKRARHDWTETDYRIALDLRLTGDEAGQTIGCSGRVVLLEREEWLFE